MTCALTALHLWKTCATLTEVKLGWVQAHRGIPGNAKSDEGAKMGAIVGMKDKPYALKDWDSRWSRRTALSQGQRADPAAARAVSETRSKYNLTDARTKSEPHRSRQ
jgi:hypothetical protein